MIFPAVQYFETHLNRGPGPVILGILWLQTPLMKLYGAHGLLTYGIDFSSIFYW